MTNIGDAESFVRDSKSQLDEESELVERAKKRQNSGINPGKKLTLIQKCVKHADKYKLGTKDVF